MKYLQKLIKHYRKLSKEYADLADSVPRKDERIDAAEDCGVFIGKSEAYENVAKDLEMAASKGDLK